MRFKYLCLLIGLYVALSGCEQDEQPQETERAKQTTFELIKPNDSGVHFVNQVRDRQDFNILTYRNFYNGGGVAIGDINNDSLPDLYFTSNLGPNKLYLNQGNFKFEDITETSQAAGQRGWSTGVTMADVNSDGFLDIYVSNSGDIQGDNKENELFINNGDLTFTERAAEYGLHNKGYSTQAAFFDYDQDGDLDCYLLNTSFKDPAKIELYKSMRDKPDELGGDKLYRNDGNTFTDVTLAAGVYSSAIGFGLGTCIGDVNRDNLPDIYVSNDFWERDYLYINQGDGTFSEELSSRMDFCSISSMGGDIADINNDGSPEIISTDMLAADNYRLKAMSHFDAYHVEDMKYRANYHYQVAQNCLHLNDGSGRFQEIAMMANVGATDWSWGALLFDFENDGFKDLFISNGLQKDLMYMDFRDYLSDQNIHQKLANDEPVDILSAISTMPSSPLINYAFSNVNGNQFKNATAQLGLNQRSFSNGSAYGDLDNDGDLDLVVNNVNMQSFIYKNQAETTGNNYLKLQFSGPTNNKFGIGATVRIKTKQGIQLLENYNTRGFQSSTEPQLIFGLGNLEIIDELLVTWPDNRTQKITTIQANQILQLKYTDAIAQPISTPKESQITSIKQSTTHINEDAKHTENLYNDFDHEPLLTHMLSSQGPHMLTGDLNNDGLEDFILLGAHDDPDKLFIQQTDGQFIKDDQLAFATDKQFESTCGALIDIDNDGDQDIVIGSGGNEYQRGKTNFLLRVYTNDGTGQFTKSRNRLPEIVGNISCITHTDIDGDGDRDIFVGSRLVPGNYGIPPNHFLLINENGTYKDQTPEALASVGMVTDASWSDIDNDGDEDLIVIGDWMAVQVFTNNNGQLSNPSSIENSEGWWNCIEAVDLDQDGDLDFVLGNTGTNSKFKTSPQKPISLYVSDFDLNGKSEFIMNWFAPGDNKAYPFPTKAEITSQIPQLKKQILKYEEYASETYESLFSEPKRQQSIPYKITTLQSSILWNDKGKLSLNPLPTAAQIAPVYASISHDFNHDGIIDIWLGGNLYGIKPQVGRHNASRGVMLLGNKDKDFTAISPTQSGIYVTGEVRDAHIIRTNNQDALLIARNNDTALLYTIE